MLVIKGRPIILVPKAVVSYSKRYTPQKYYNQFVLEYLRNDHLKRKSKLVQKRASGAFYVTKKSVAIEHPYSKEYLADFTQRHPDIFASFKEWIAHDAKSIPQDDLSEISRLQVSSYLAQKLSKIPAGKTTASQYHTTAVSILDFLFYPALITPLVEVEIHSGRKRIDITFDNGADSGFFYRIHTIHKIPSQYIFVECKNYSHKVSNPEADQLSGRFSYNRGRLGFLLFRNIDDIESMMLRSSDAYKDGRGVIIPICDADLLNMLDLAKDEKASPYEKLLSDRLRTIIMG